MNTFCEDKHLTLKHPVPKKKFGAQWSERGIRGNNPLQRSNRNLLPKKLQLANNILGVSENVLENETVDAAAQFTHMYDIMHIRTFEGAEILVTQSNTSFVYPQYNSF